MIYGLESELTEEISSYQLAWFYRVNYAYYECPTYKILQD